MKIQIDSNNYLTGAYCYVGNIDNSVEMEHLPDCDVQYYAAYKLLSKEIDKVILAYEEINREETIEIPILDDNGNETGETKEEIISYKSMEPVEAIVKETVYYYELDEARKSEIDKTMQSSSNSKTSQEIIDLQLAICELYEKIGGTV